MQALISRYEAAKPGMQFVLDSPYDTSNPRLEEYAQDLYEIAEADPQNLLFLNLYAMAGSFPHLDANYLIDHVHENAAGNLYMAEQVDRLLEMAKFGYANQFTVEQAGENLAVGQATVI